MAAVCLLAGLLVPLPGTAQSTATPPSNSSSGPTQVAAASVRSVRVIAENAGPAIEIIFSRPVVPTLGKLERPSRLVVDLPGASVTSRQRIPVASDEISAVRVDQYRDAPPVARVVVDLLQPVTYTWDAAGNRLMVRLHSMLPAKAKPAMVPASAPAGQTAGVHPATVQPALVHSVTGSPVGVQFSAAQSSPVQSVRTQPAAVPPVAVQPVAVLASSPSAGTVLPGVRRVSSGYSVTAGANTTVLTLAGGGQVRVCTGTTVSVTPSQSGHELMLGMSTGALEAHYKLDASADSVVTPDFRILLAGPGEFHYAISADSRGNTCVRALPGNTASAIVSELMGNGTYQVKPNEQVVFRGGRLSSVDTVIPGDCGCPSPGTSVLRASGPDAPAVPAPAETLPAIPLPGVSSSEPGNPPPAQVTLSEAGPETAPLPPSKPDDVHIQVDAPLVFRASDLKPSSQPAGPPPGPAPTLEAALLPVRLTNSPELMNPPALPPEAKPEVKEEHHGFFASIGRFFAAIFR